MTDPLAIKLNDKLINRVCLIFKIPLWLLNTPATIKRIFTLPKWLKTFIDDALFALIGRPLAAIVGVIGLILFLLGDFIIHIYKGKSASTYFNIP